MSYSLPPLNPLKAFEATARCGSLARAAEELGVTTAAIGQQVRVLEGYFGVILLQRGHATNALTREGRDLYEGVARPFRDIAFALEHAGQYKHENQLLVRSYVTLTQFWLFPRLPQFQARHPEISLELKSPPPPIMQGDTDNLDAIFRVGCGEWHQFDAIRIAQLVLVPVCAPGYAARMGLKTPADILNATLLGSAHRPHDWQDWAAAVGRGSGGVGWAQQNVIRYESSSMSYEAAISGLGVALAVHDFIRPQLEQGRLVMPVDHPHDMGEGFYLTWDRDRPLTPAFVAFRDWLASVA